MSASPADGAPIDPFSLLRQVAEGDLCAMRSMREVAVARAVGGAADPFVTIMEGLVFARLAACVGNVGDRGAVIAMLALAAEIGGDGSSDELMGEAFARAAAEDDDTTTSQLLVLAEAMSSEAMRFAKDYQTRMGAK